MTTAPDLLAARPGALAAALGSRSFRAGAALTAGFAALALLSFVWTPYDVEALAIDARLRPRTGSGPTSSGATCSRW